jgi:hypothetical protein
MLNISALFVETLPKRPAGFVIYFKHIEFWFSLGYSLNSPVPLRRLGSVKSPESLREKGKNMKPQRTQRNTLCSPKSLIKRSTG